MGSDHAPVFAVPTFSSRSAPAASNAIDRWALTHIQGAVAGAHIDFRLWDGFELKDPTGNAVATVVIRNRHALYSWVWHPELNFGEAYMFGAVEIQGDLPALLEEIYLALRRRPPARWRFPHATNTPHAARENVHRHYDLGNDFYRLWLDREMVYTCAYFADPRWSLEEAQTAKMELVCRKLRLQPGERVVEAGCGWGSLAIFMAKRFGVTVRAFNISAEQIAYARERARREGVDDRVEFVEDDYRNVSGRFEAFVSVGMLEHVELPDYGTLGHVIDRSLTEEGRALLHFIGRNRPAPLNPWIRKRIFPGGYPPALREVCEHILEPYGFSMLDVENLRRHYVVTLEHWFRRFEGQAEKLAGMFDETFTRAWRLYLAGSRAAFTTGSMQLFQIVLARGASNAIPWSRSDEQSAFRC